MQKATVEQLNRLESSISEDMKVFVNAHNALASELDTLADTLGYRFDTEMAKQQLREVKTWSKVLERLDSLRLHQSYFNDKLKNLDFTECEKCGCVIKRIPENRGQSTIEITDGREHIKRHYFCKLHMPKSK